MWLSPHCGSARTCGHANEHEHNKLANERDEVVDVQHATLRKNDEADKVHSSTRWATIIATFVCTLVDPGCGTTGTRSRLSRTAMANNPNGANANVATQATCTQHITKNDPFMRGHIGLYDAHYNQFARFFADTKYSPKILVQNLRDVNWPELAVSFADTFASALLCQDLLTEDGRSTDKERDIAEEFGFLNKLATAMAFNQAEVEFLPQWYSDALALFVVRVIIRFGMLVTNPTVSEKYLPKWTVATMPVFKENGLESTTKAAVAMCTRAFLPFVAKLHPLLPNSSLKHSSEGVFGLMVAIENVGNSLFFKSMRASVDSKLVPMVVDGIAEVIAAAVCQSPNRNLFDWHSPFGYFVGAPLSRQLHTAAAGREVQAAQREARCTVYDPDEVVRVAALKTVQRTWTSHLYWLIHAELHNYKRFDCSAFEFDVPQNNGNSEPAVADDSPSASTAPSREISPPATPFRQSSAEPSIAAPVRNSRTCDGKKRARDEQAGQNGVCAAHLADLLEQLSKEQSPVASSDARAAISAKRHKGRALQF